MSLGFHSVSMRSDPSRPQRRFSWRCWWTTCWRSGTRGPWCRGITLGRTFSSTRCGAVRRAGGRDWGYGDLFLREMKMAARIQSHTCQKHAFTAGWDEVTRSSGKCGNCLLKSFGMVGSFGGWGSVQQVLRNFLPEVGRPRVQPARKSSQLL